MGKIQDFLRNNFGVGKEKKATEVVDKEQVTIAKELIKELGLSVNKKAYAYVSGSARNLSKDSAVMNKSYSTLRSLYSEAPGAIQCGNVIKNRILGGGFVIKPVNENDEIDETDKDYVRLAQFLINPNREETLEDIWSGMIQNYLMYGNAFLEKVIGTDGMVEEVYNLDTEVMNIVVDKELRAQGIELAMQYSRSVGENKRIIYELNEVVHFRMPDPRGSLYGQAILENHQAVLSMVIQALVYNVNFLKNNGRNQIQINLPAETDENQAQAFKAYYDKEYAGAENSGKALITFAGAEAKTLGATIQDMDYLNLMAFCKKEIAGMFGVPLVMISDPEGTNRASSIEERRGFHVNYVLPERSKLLGKFNREVINAGLGITKYKLDVEELDVEDQGKLTTEAKEAMSSGLATPNEAAKYAGWSTVQDHWADEKYIISGANGIKFETLGTAEPVDPNAPVKPGKKDKNPDSQSNPDANAKDKPTKKTAMTLKELRQKINQSLGY